jgi:hypothetical protein
VALPWNPTVQFGGNAPGDAPITHAIEVTLAEATERSPLVRARPDSDLASDATVERVWITDPEAKGAEPQAVIAYDSGISVSWMKAHEALARQYEMVATTFPGASATEMNGRPALLIDDSSNPSFAIIVDDVEVIIYGNLTEERFRAIAETIP